MCSKKIYIDNPTRNPIQKYQPFIPSRTYKSWIGADTSIRVVAGAKSPVGLLLERGNCGQPPRWYAASTIAAPCIILGTYTGCLYILRVKLQRLHLDLVWLGFRVAMLLILFIIIIPANVLLLQPSLQNEKAYLLEKNYLLKYLKGTIKTRYILSYVIMFRNLKMADIFNEFCMQEKELSFHSLFYLAELLWRILNFDVWLNFLDRRSVYWVDIYIIFM